MIYHFQPIRGTVMKFVWCGQRAVTIGQSIAKIQPQSHFGIMTQLCSSGIWKRFCLTTQNPFFFFLARCEGVNLKNGPEGWKPRTFL